MSLQEQNILFFTRTMKLGGTENVVLQLCEIFQPLANKVVVCSCGGVNEEKLKQMGIKHIQIDDIEKKSISTVLGTIKSLKKIIREENITVIHTHHRMAAFYVSLLNLYKNCIFINTSHNTFANKKVLTRFAYKHGNLIACGEMVKKNLVDEYGLSGEKVTVIHNAVKMFNGEIVFDSLIKRLHDEGNFVIGNIGRLSEQKGMQYFIEAIPEVIKKHPNTRFVIAGSGEDEENLKKLSKALHVEKYLTFLGFRRDVQNLMSQLDLIVLSSLWEGLPLTPIEAFSVGKTIVATDVDGTPEIVLDNINGLLVRKRNSMEISNAIIRCIEDASLRKALENEAYRTYVTEFSYKEFCNRIINYYEMVI